MICSIDLSTLKCFHCSHICFHCSHITLNPLEGYDNNQHSALEQVSLFYRSNSTLTSRYTRIPREQRQKLQNLQQSNIFFSCTVDLFEFGGSLGRTTFQWQNLGEFHTTQHNGLQAKIDHGIFVGGGEKTHICVRWEFLSRAFLDCQTMVLLHAPTFKLNHCVLFRIRSFFQHKSYQ